MLIYHFLIVPHSYAGILQTLFSPAVMALFLLQYTKKGKSEKSTIKSNSGCVYI